MAKHEQVLKYEVYVAAKPERVWQALTDGALTEQYFYGSRVESEFTPGAKVSYGAGGVPMISGEVLAVEKAKEWRMTQRSLWDDAVAKEPATKVRWQLAALGDATKVSLTHEGFDGAQQTYAQSAEGWPLILSGLKTLLETGKPLALARG